MPSPSVQHSGASPAVSIEGSAVANKKIDGRGYHPFDLLYQLHTTGLTLSVGWRNVPSRQSLMRPSFHQSSSHSSALHSASNSSHVSASLPSTDTDSASSISETKKDHSATADHQTVSAPQPQLAVSKGFSVASDGSQNVFETINAVVCIPLKSGSEAARLFLRRIDNDSPSQQFTSSVEFTLNPQTVTFLPLDPSELNDTSLCPENLYGQDRVLQTGVQDGVKCAEQGISTPSSAPVSPDGGVKDNEESTESRAKPATFPRCSTESPRSCPTDTNTSSSKAPGCRECSYISREGATSPDCQVPSACPAEPTSNSLRSVPVVSPSSPAPARAPSASGSGCCEAGLSSSSVPSDAKLSPSSYVDSVGLCGDSTHPVSPSEPSRERQAVVLQGPDGVEVVIRCRSGEPETSWAVGSQSDKIVRPDSGTDLPCTVVCEALRILQLYGFRQSALLSSLTDPSSSEKGCGDLAKATAKLNLQVLCNVALASPPAIPSVALEGTVTAAQPVAIPPELGSAPECRQSSATEKTELTGNLKAFKQASKMGGLPTDGDGSEECGRSDQGCSRATRPVRGASATVSPKLRPSECDRSDRGDGTDEKPQKKAEGSEERQHGTCVALDRMLQSLGYSHSSVDLSLVYLAAAGLLVSFLCTRASRHRTM
ncbi:conserved hypothetical protein [Neospora caninum Liverpool]|uniref:Uncharacterized protein n=1 Tax=Neospora caninum (strain Liverpool) TaxID=572307 RepID=F0VJL1_NEOCL|nr:conserved hypothetical protein [Neospora caninum Liverpool]CBZ53922.1 conserved hypothetical protein [Neospora caninum Liverpool]|eukprot:XP_003883954.1 conserved hypothetical protein [Neospora caninum Liverpool]